MSKYDGIGEPLDEIIICGFCLSICVAANAIMLRAKYPGVKITIKKNLCGDVDKEAFDAAVKVLQMQQIDVV
jgi:nicotinamidase-related amidase